MKKALLLVILSLVLILGTSGEGKQTLVLICTGKYAHAYHKYECKGLKNCNHEIIKTTLEEAKKKGYKPCGYCYK